MIILDMLQLHTAAATIDSECWNLRYFHGCGQDICAQSGRKVPGSCQSRRREALTFTGKRFQRRSQVISSYYIILQKRKMDFLSMILFFKSGDSFRVSENQVLRLASDSVGFSLSRRQRKCFWPLLCWKLLLSFPLMWLQKTDFQFSDGISRSLQRHENLSESTPLSPFDLSAPPSCSPSPLQRRCASLAMATKWSQWNFDAAKLWNPLQLASCHLTSPKSSCTGLSLRTGRPGSAGYSDAMVPTLCGKWWNTIPLDCWQVEISQEKLQFSLNKSFNQRWT